jgi:[ribosomal protein S18]-alanine N-acetyltransferase
VPQIARQAEPLRLHAAADDDAAETAALGAVAFRETHRHLLQPAVVDAIVMQIYSEDRIRRAIATCRESSCAFFLVARHASELVGFLEYGEAEDEPELHRLYVDPSRKGLGIGTALLAELHRRLPAGRRYRVTAHAGNAEALGFYKRRGFTESGRRVQHYPGVELPPDAQPGPVVFLRAPPNLRRRSRVSL